MLTPKKNIIWWTTYTLVLLLQIMVKSFISIPACFDSLSIGVMFKCFITNCWLFSSSNVYVYVYPWFWAFLMKVNPIKSFGRRHETYNVLFSTFKKFTFNFRRESLISVTCFGYYGKQLISPHLTVPLLTFQIVSHTM